MRVRLRGVIAAFALLFLTTPIAASAPGRAQGPFMGALVGAHVGVDYLFEGLLVGGQTILQLDPWGRLSLIPNAELEFRQGLRDWQANADAAVMPFPGVYVGGGASWRNTIFDEEEGRATRHGWSFFFGYRDPPSPRRFSPQIELRWSFISDIEPRMLTIGLNFPVLLFQ